MAAPLHSGRCRRFPHLHDCLCHAPALVRPLDGVAEGVRVLAVADTTPRATYRAMADALVAQWNRPDVEGEDFTYRLLDVASTTAPREILLAVIARLDWIAGTRSEKSGAELPDTLAAPLDAFAALSGL